MPKIDAPTVREHHEQKFAALIAAADEILRTEGLAGLTAAAVTEQAGIARNSLYRYVDSVGDLYAHVITKVLPEWNAAVDEALAGVQEPAQRLRIYLAANIEQAALGRHGSLMMMAARVKLSPAVSAMLKDAHDGKDEIIGTEWRRLGVDSPALYAGMTNSLMAAAFRAADHGIPVERVIAVAADGLDGLLAGAERSRRP